MRGCRNGRRSPIRSATWPRTCGSTCALIAEMIEPGTRVLDIGCGDGTLIEQLYRTKGCDARGIEIDMAEVTRAVAHGLPVMHGDADTDLAQYPDHAFDYVVLSRTLQAVEQPRQVLRADAADRHARGRQLPEFRPLAGALAVAVDRADADDDDLGAALARNAEHPSLHHPRLLRALRRGRTTWSSNGSPPTMTAAAALAALPGWPTCSANRRCSSSGAPDRQTSSAGFETSFELRLCWGAFSCGADNFPGAQFQEGSVGEAIRMVAGIRRGAVLGRARGGDGRARLRRERVYPGLRP